MAQRRVEEGMQANRTSPDVEVRRSKLCQNLKYAAAAETKASSGEPIVSSL